jgi:flavodoxin
MKNALVVYYSLSGHTKTLAERVAREGGWAVASIDDVNERTGAFGYLRAALRTSFGVKPSIRYSGPSPSAFDLIVLGGPVWVGKMASPLHTFVANHRHEFKSLALFCTYGGSGGDKAMQGLAKLCAAPPIATLAVTEAQLKSNTYTNAMTTFINGLQRVSGVVIDDRIRGVLEKTKGHST